MVQLQNQLLVDRLVGETALGAFCLELLDAQRKMGCELGIAEDAEGGIQVAGGVVRRLSSASSIFWSTGSPSKAMLRATLLGIRLMRVRRCSSGGSLRQY